MWDRRFVSRAVARATFIISHFVPNIKIANRQVQGVPQSQTAANIPHQEEEKNDEN